MTNVIPITAAHPLIGMLEDIKKAVMKGDLNSCVVLAVDTSGESYFVKLIEPEDDNQVIGMLERVKLEILLGIGEEYDEDE